MLVSASDLDDAIPESHGVEVDVAGEDVPPSVSFAQVAKRVTKSREIEHLSVVAEVVLNAGFNNTLGNATEEAQFLLEIDEKFSPLAEVTFGLNFREKMTQLTRQLPMQANDTLLKTDILQMESSTDMSNTPSS